MKNNRVARAVFALIFLAGFIFYTYRQEQIHSHSVDVEWFGEAGGLKPEGFDAQAVIPEQPAAIPEAPQPTPEIPPEPVEEGPKLPEVDLSDWNLILVNKDNPLSADYAPPTIVEVGDSRCPQDSRISDALTAFAQGCKDAGLPVYLSSGYRSYNEQSSSFNNKVAQVGSEEAAAKIVSRPGTSEHQTGLCCDITDQYRNPKDPDVIEPTETFQWLNEHCAEYGFILRYPKDKTEVTGIMYEPWHFRYVGQEVAAYIKDNGLCLEEFVALYETEVGP